MPTLAAQMKIIDLVAYLQMIEEASESAESLEHLQAAIADIMLRFRDYPAWLAAQ